MLPIFTRINQSRKRLFNIEDIVSTLLWPTLEKKFICKRVPVVVCHNVCFLVDTDTLSDPADVLCDDMGAWKNNRVDSVAVVVSQNENEITNVKRINPSVRLNTNMYTLQRVYRIHKTDSTLRKIISTMFGKSFMSAYAMLCINIQ